MPQETRRVWAPPLFFIGIFLVACLVQGIQWREFDMVDGGMWGNEAQYVQQHDSREFNFLQAYGHPGGPIIEGAIALHSIFNFSYEKSVLAFVTLFNSLIIAGAVLLAYLLRRRTFWWIPVFGTLSLNRLYDFATPPTAVVTALISLLCLLTLYIFEKREGAQPVHILLFGLISGLAVATRADIGSFASAVFLALIVTRIGWKNTGLIIAEAAAVFCVFDPFMWFMPVQHLRDLVSKIVLHYAEFVPNHIGPTEFVTAAALSLIAVFLSIQLLLLRKRVSPAVPPLFVVALLLMTGALCAIFFSSHYQAIRYFLPLLFIWELFLPLLIFSLVDTVRFSFTPHPQIEVRMRNILKGFVVVLIFFYYLSSMVLSLQIANAYHVVPL